MKIIIESIKEQRYDTLGDWFYENGDLHVRVSSIIGGRFEVYLIAIHELIEAILCERAGITPQQVDEFDLNYNGIEREPGDDMNCPYRRQHRFAMLIEHLVAHELGMVEYGKVE